MHARSEQIVNVNQPLLAQTYIPFCKFFTIFEEKMKEGFPAAPFIKTEQIVPCDCLLKQGNC